MQDASDSQTRELEGLPVIRRQVAGIDLGSERHWVCAPKVDGNGREVTSFGATTSSVTQLPNVIVNSKNRIDL